MSMIPGCTEWELNKICIQSTVFHFKVNKWIKTTLNSVLRCPFSNLTLKEVLNNSCHRFHNRHLAILKIILSLECNNSLKFKLQCLFPKVSLKILRISEDSLKHFIQKVLDFHLRASSIFLPHWVFIQILCRTRWRKCKLTNELVKECMIQRTMSLEVKLHHEV